MRKPAIKLKYKKDNTGTVDRYVKTLFMFLPFKYGKIRKLLYGCHFMCQCGTASFYLAKKISVYSAIASCKISSASELKAFVVRTISPNSGLNTLRWSRNPLRKAGTS